MGTTLTENELLKVHIILLYDIGSLILQTQIQIYV